MLRPRQLLGLRTLLDTVFGSTKKLWRNRNYHKQRNKQHKKQLTKLGHFNYLLNDEQLKNRRNMDRRVNIMRDNHQNIKIRAMYCLKTIKTIPFIKTLIYDHLKPMYVSQTRISNRLIDNNYARNIGIVINTCMDGLPTRAYDTVIKGVCYTCFIAAY